LSLNIYSNDIVLRGETISILYLCGHRALKSNLRIPSGVSQVDVGNKEGEGEAVESWSSIVTGSDLSITVLEQCMTYNHLILK
jgi:hypothetical protein